MATLRLSRSGTGFLLWTAAGFLSTLWLGALWLELLGRPGSDAVLGLGAQCGVTAWLVLHYGPPAVRPIRRRLKRMHRAPLRCNHL